jgi:hypothetical protein
MKIQGASQLNLMELPQGNVQLFGSVPQMPLRKKLPGISFIVKLSMGSVQLSNNKPIA